MTKRTDSNENGPTITTKDGRPWFEQTVPADNDSIQIITHGPFAGCHIGPTPDGRRRACFDERGRVVAYVGDRNHNPVFGAARQRQRTADDRMRQVRHHRQRSK